MIAIKVPGSKSITNRALIAAALAKGRSVLRGALESDDTRHMRLALQKLGVKIEKRGDALSITGGRLRKTGAHLFCGNAGTAVRFLSAVLAGQDFESTIDGDRRMRERPIKDLLDALNQLGASACSIKKNGCPPVKIRGPLLGGECALEGNISSQFLSGLLLAAPLAQKDVEIHVRSGLVSKPYVDLTLDVMGKFGIKVRRDGYKKFFIKAGQKYKPAAFKVEGDASSASYFWGLAALTGEKIEVVNVPNDSKQADAVSQHILSRFRISDAIKDRSPTEASDKSGMTKIASPRRASRPGLAMTINCSDFPDSAMTLAVLSAFRNGKTRLTGLANLRVKECNRLHALAKELKKIGADARELPDGLLISGNPEKLRGAEIETYNDHRMAMCFGMASVVLHGMKIKNPACVNKTYPNFWKDLSKIRKILRTKNIILTGMRGTGKTKLGSLLAKKLKRKFIDIDREIEKRANKKIAEIVKQRGWRYFRELEKNAVEKLRTIKNAVISTGGGTLMYKQNAGILKKNGKVILLDCPPHILRKRLAASKKRPSLTKKRDFLNELKEIYAKREKRYLEAADAVLDVSKNNINAKLKSMLQMLNRLGIY